MGNSVLIWITGNGQQNSNELAFLYLGNVIITAVSTTADTEVSYAPRILSSLALLSCPDRLKYILSFRAPPHPPPTLPILAPPSNELTTTPPPQFLKRTADPQLARALGYDPADTSQSTQGYRAAAGSVAGGDIITIWGDKFVEESRCPAAVATSTGSSYGSMRLTQSLTGQATTCK